MYLQDQGKLTNLVNCSKKSQISYGYLIFGLYSNHLFGLISTWSLHTQWRHITIMHYTIAVNATDFIMTRRAQLRGMGDLWVYMYIYALINPWCMREGYSSHSVCVYVQWCRYSTVKWHRAALSCREMGGAICICYNGKLYWACL